ncbi:MAG: 2-oxo acid dehydrogenase subunit E2 [Gammaproteobacteria bacterium]|nr:2-oxo acid dehydrogenase subunit E2 [Gammaproteobacteria bacterium]
MTDPVDITAPAEQTEGTRSQLLRWLKRVGEPVQRNEPLIELETDKVTVEVAAPASGVLSEILKQEQDEVTPGETLGRIAPAVAAAATPPAAPSASPPRGPAAAAARTTAGALSPAVRRLLTEHGLSPAAISGSGEGGRITVDDVLAAAQRGAPAPAPASRPAASAPEGAPSHRIPHTPVRKRIAEHMVQSLLHTAPHVTTVFEADLGAVLAHRARHREALAREGVSLTLTAYFVQACVAAIRAVPEANSRWSDNELEVYEAMHVGIATAVEGTGLMVPVLRDAQALDLRGTAAALGELTARARENRLTPADMRGGTFTISNHGVSGSLLAAPIIINQPQSAILGVGKLERRAVVSGEGAQEQVVVRPRCYVTLTLDHRVMDGHRANRFLSTLVERLERWPAD